MFLFGKGKVSGTMPPDMKYDDAARMPNLSNNDWQKLNKLIAESDPELGRVMKNAVRPPGILCREYRIPTGTLTCVYIS